MPESRRFPPPWTVEELEACFIVIDGGGQKLAYVYFEEEPGRRSAAKLLTKDGGAADRGEYRPSCQSYYAERDLAPSDARGRINTLMNLIAVTAKMAKTKRSPYSRGLSSTKLYSRSSRKKSAHSNAMTLLNTARRPLYSAAIKVTGKR